MTAPPPNPAFQNYLTVLVSPDRGATWATRFSGRNCSAPRSSLRTRGATPHGQHTLGFPRSVRLGGDGLAHRHALRCLAGCPLQYRRVPSIDRIVFSRSTDGGQTWSDPTTINATPTTIPPLDQQAFVPAIQVAGDGTIGVSYYDFRNNRPSATGGLADAWMVFCPPGANPTLAASWGGEVRLTNQ